MKKINILKKNMDFQRIISTKKPYKSKNYIIYIDKAEDNYYFGISVSKKIGTAVTRSKIKRQIKNIIDKKIYKKGFICIIIVKRSILNLTYKEMEKELHDIFDNLRLTKGEKDEK